MCKKIEKNYRNVVEIYENYASLEILPPDQRGFSKSKKLPSTQMLLNKK